MPTAAVLFAPGFEEIEAVTIVDVLRRAGIEVFTAGLGGRQITGSHQITLQLDGELAGLPPALNALVLPGGMPGSTQLARDPAVRDRLRATDAAGQVVAAICAAPLALAAAGLLKGRRYTCFPGVEQHIADGTYTGRRVEVDERLITGSAAGVSLEFALALATALGAGAAAAQLQQNMQILSATPTERC